MKKNERHNEKRRKIIEITLLFWFIRTPLLGALHPSTIHKNYTNDSSRRALIIPLSKRFAFLFFSSSKQNGRSKLYKFSTRPNKRPFFFFFFLFLPTNARGTWVNKQRRQVKGKDKQQKASAYRARNEKQMQMHGVGSDSSSLLSFQDWQIDKTRKWGKSDDDDGFAETMITGRTRWAWAGSWLIRA